MCVATEVGKEEPKIAYWSNRRREREI